MKKYIGIEELKDINNRDILEKHNDVFTHELIMRSAKTRCYYEYVKEIESGYERTEAEERDLSIHHNVPLDVIYKSNSSGERVFLEIDLDGLYFIHKVVFNINGRKNIEILKNDNPMVEDETFEITREQLHELCKASSLKIQIRGYEGVKWEGNANGFITILQVLYNEAFDNYLFTDAHNTAVSYTMTEIKKIEEKIKAGEALAKKRQQEIQQAKQRQDQIDKTYSIIAIISLIITLFAIIWLVWSGGDVMAIILSSLSGVASITFSVLAWGYLLY